MPLAVLLTGSALTTAYFAWQWRTEVPNPFHPATASQSKPTTKADLPLPISPTTPNHERDLLARAKVENELLFTDLQSFVCNEHIDRFKGKANSDDGHHVDTVTAKVSFENGVENYSDIRQNNRERPAMSSLHGAWSAGEFGTLLRQTHALLGAQPVSLKDDENLDGTPTSVYTINVSEKDSPWTLNSGGTQYSVPFRTDVWVAKSSGQILKIARVSAKMPPQTGIAEIAWNVSLSPVDLDGKTWLLPKTGEYQVLYASSNHREWNVMNFSDYHRYGSRVVMNF